MAHLLTPLVSLIFDLTGFVAFSLFFIFQKIFQNRLFYCAALRKSDSLNENQNHALNIQKLLRTLIK